MARVYMITETEMQSLMDQLELSSMADKNIFISKERLAKVSEETRTSISDMHRSFHYVCVRWAQEMGFKGYRS